jgi:hypothetical protein
LKLDEEEVIQVEREAEGVEEAWGLLEELALCERVFHGQEATVAPTVTAARAMEAQQEQPRLASES